MEASVHQKNFMQRIQMTLEGSWISFLMSSNQNFLFFSYFVNENVFSQLKEYFLNKNNLLNENSLLTR